MPLKKLAVAEEAVSLSETKRTDREIEEELTRRLDVLVSGKDAGLTFEQVFDAAN